jgi:hypothetical protein
LQKKDFLKEISWEICRLEAFNIEESNQSQQQQQQQQTPTSIKLIMNPSKIQIALKKKLSDKSLLNSTFRILLNEIYWMANDTQLKAAIGTYNTISKLIKKSALQKRKHMAYKQQQQQQQQPTKPQVFNNSNTNHILFINIIFQRIILKLLAVSVSKQILKFLKYFSSMI